MGIYKGTELEKIREAGKTAAIILMEISKYVKAGVSTTKIDRVAGELMKKMNAKSAPKMLHDFPSNLCISINEVVAHGIAERRFLRCNDLVHIDVAIEKAGYFGDIGYTFIIGQGSELQRKVCQVSKEALDAAIAVSCAGNPINMIGKTIYDIARENGFTVLRNLCSHGVGKKLHEHPTNIYNYENDEQTELLEEGMVIAIEPYISSEAVRAISSGDGHSFTTHNQSIVAQFEHTILITGGKAEILTKI